MTFVSRSCHRCGTPMKHFISSYDKKLVEFWRCPVCWAETPHTRLVYKSEKPKSTTNKLEKTKTNLPKKAKQKKDVKKVAGKRRKSTGLRRNGR